MRFVVNIINEYDPGPFPEDFGRKVIQLASNENPYPPHQEVVSVLKDSAMEINRYVSPYYKKLKESISEYLGVEPSNIAVSNGASDLLRLVADLVVEPFDRVFIPLPSFTPYMMFSMLREAQVETRVFEGYKVDGCYDKGKLAFLCSPNNPTGNVIARKVIEEHLENFDYVVVDEAYSEFSGRSVVDLINHYENLIVVRSFSKFFGLAGMRVGYAVANEKIANAIEKIRNPFPLSTLAYKAAITALKHVDYYRKVAEIIVGERERIAKKLKKMFYVYDSQANFLLVRHDIDDIAKRLMDKGILVRDLTGLEGLDGPHFRVSVGRRYENDAFLKALEEII